MSIGKNDFGDFLIPKKYMGLSNNGICILGKYML